MKIFSNFKSFTKNEKNSSKNKLIR